MDRCFDCDNKLPADCANAVMLHINRTPLSEMICPMCGSKLVFSRDAQNLLVCHLYDALFECGSRYILGPYVIRKASYISDACMMLSSNLDDVI